MHELSVMYKVVARSKDGRVYHYRGLTGLWLASPFAVQNGLVELFASVLDGFVNRELGRREAELANLSHLTVRFERIEVE